MLGLCALASLSLTGCATKVGLAAEVGSSRISESQLASYLTPNAKSITLNTQTASGDTTQTTVSARAFALQFAVASVLFQQVIDSAGTQPSAADLATAKAAVLQGSTEDALTKQLTALGMAAKLEPVYLKARELYAVLSLQKKTDAQIQQLSAKVHVRINPRFGSWNSSSLSVTDLSKAQLPAAVSYSGTLPGDPQPGQ